MLTTLDIHRSFTVLLCLLFLQSLCYICRFVRDSITVFFCCYKLTIAVSPTDNALFFYNALQADIPSVPGTGLHIHRLYDSTYGICLCTAKLALKRIRTTWQMRLAEFKPGHDTDVHHAVPEITISMARYNL